MKRNYWPLLFIGLFSFSFGMIVWTIYSAVQVPVHEDESLLKSYHDLDRDYNNIVASNTKFKNKYDFNIKINNKNFPLVISDMFLSQRALEEKSTHKDIFINGQNKITITIKDKVSGLFVNATDLSLRISRPTNHHNTLDFKHDNFKHDDKKHILDVNLPLKGNWNATGEFKVGNDVGYIYIKSNAI